MDAMDRARTCARDRARTIDRASVAGRQALRNHNCGTRSKSARRTTGPEIAEWSHFQEASICCRKHPTRVTTKVSDFGECWRPRTFPQPSERLQPCCDEACRCARDAGSCWLSSSGDSELPRRARASRSPLVSRSRRHDCRPGLVVV